MNILAVGAHHDDIELGCAGALAKYASEGHQVYGLILTDSETHYDLKEIHRTKGAAINEGRRAAEKIGMELCELDHPPAQNGCLEYNVQLMRQLELFMDEKKICTVFTHWHHDMNTDHVAASRLVITAGRHVPRMLMYRSNWYQPEAPFNGTFFIDISNHMEQKRESLECYAGEINNRSREWINTFIEQNRCWGFQIGAAYAEMFEPVRWVMPEGKE